MFFQLVGNLSSSIVVAGRRKLLVDLWKAEVSTEAVRRSPCIVSVQPLEGRLSKSCVGWSIFKQLLEAANMRMAEEGEGEGSLSLGQSSSLTACFPHSSAGVVVA